MHRIVLICCLLAAMSLCWCQQTALPPAFSSNTYPARLTLGELTAEWMKVEFFPDGQGQNMLLMMMNHNGFFPADNACYSKGHIVALGGKPYLVIYRPERVIPQDPEAAAAVMALNPQTPLFPTLVDLRAATQIKYCGPFDLKREIRASTRRLMLNRHHGEGNNEAALIDNLAMLRSAVAQFKEDTGVYPARLEDLVLPPEKAPAQGINADGKPAAIKAGTYAGPYLPAQGGIPDASGIPMNPYVDLGMENPDPMLVSTHWKYVDGAIGVPDFLFGLRTGSGVMLGEL